MANLLVTAKAEIVPASGTTPVVGRQGAAGAAPTTPLTISVDGNVNEISGALADATAKGLWASGETTNQPSFVYLWTSAAAILELVTASGGVRLVSTATLPIIIAGGVQLADDFTTTPISADPTLENITDINLWNNSGSAINYHAIIVD